MNRPESASRAERRRAAIRARGGRIGVLIVNLGTPDATDAAVGAALSARVSQRRPGDREPGAGLEVRAQRHHPAAPAAASKAATTRRSGTASATNRRSRPSPARRPPSSAPTLDAIDPTIMVDWAMRYGNPSLDTRIEALAKAGCERILLLPLYPQYAAATSATVCDAAFLDADQAARPAGAARRAAVLRRPGLYRGAGRLDRGRAEAAAVRARADPRLVPRHPEILRRRGRSLSEPLRGDGAAPARAARSSTRAS